MPQYLGTLGNTVPGICMLIHSYTNAGKTHSSITAPPKILHINKEPKDPRLVHSLIRPDYLNLIDYVEFDGFEDEEEGLNSLIEVYKTGRRPYETIFHDGLTFAMANTKATLESNRFDAKELAKKDEEKAKPGLLDYSSLIQKDWGTLASLTARSTRLLHQLSKFGVMVVSTAISTEHAKWNNSVEIVPSLTGQEFPKLIHGWFDTIGYIIKPFHIGPNGEKVEPRISFISPSSGGWMAETGTYMVRANPRLIEAERKYGPIKLDLTLIASIIRGTYEL